MRRIVFGLALTALLLAPMAALAGGAPGPSVLSAHSGNKPSVLSAHPYGGASVLGIHQGFARPWSQPPAHVHGYFNAHRQPVWVQPQWMWDGWQWVWVPGYWTR